MRKKPGPPPVIRKMLAACADGNHDDCVGKFEMEGRRYVCECDHHGARKTGKR